MTAVTDKTIASRAVMAGASSLSSKASYGSAVGTAFFGMRLDEWGVIAGIAIGVLTFLLNAYYQRQKYKLDVLLAQSQLEKVATATVDESQRALIDRIRDELVKEFGDANKREKKDRRVWNDPNYKGVERRKEVRRKGITGDTEAARALEVVTAVTQGAIKELDNKIKETAGD